MTHPIIFTSLNHTLSGALYKPDGDGAEIKAALLILAGGGNIPHNEGWYPELQQSLSEQGIASLAFDFAGVGQSEGVFSETSISTRIEDAQKALAVLRENTSAQKLYVIGTSMGAPVALSVLAHVAAAKAEVGSDIDGLILLVPAAYSPEARTKRFGPEFREEIRKGEWQDSPEFEHLLQFNGNVLLAYGTVDEVVPRGIYEKYTSIVSEKSDSTVFEFESLGHKFMLESDAVSERAREQLGARIASFILHV